ncbi:UNVERIFIED_CONTAM: hypothetical protein Sangu_3149000 [Sesamum angustifolium]|uniref:Uncharacterized protein n=1 Tax=Sesamum angustifolium TaxID=2727405 RepID=A0AAW2JZI4_9LAMI
MKQPSKPPLKGFVPSTQEEEGGHEALAIDEKGFDPKAFNLGKLPPEATGKKLHGLNATQIMLKEKGHAIQDSRVGLGFTPPKPVRITIKRVNSNYISEGFSSTEDHKREENLRESVFNRLGPHRKELGGIANRQSVFDRCICMVLQGNARIRSKGEVNKLIEVGFIREVKYPMWISSIVPVRKKNGQIRVCVDFRDLNNACPKDDFPLPIAELMIDATTGHEALSFMDGSSGYNQYVWHRQTRS